jgi:hypothetical protein
MQATKEEEEEEEATEKIPHLLLRRGTADKREVS